jgi:UDP-sulfoquinovose synthase
LITPISIYIKDVFVNGKTKNKRRICKMKKLKIMICGSDGYIGHALTMKLARLGHRIIGIDNGSRRDAVKAHGSVSATNIEGMYDRHDTYHKIGNFTFIKMDVALEPGKLNKMIDHHKPDVIVNLAHNPSAPASMQHQPAANEILTNNILGTNNILWGMKQFSPETHYITVGSTGEYNHTINVDIEEGYFNFEHNGRTSEKCLFPREANSIYHASKISSTYLIDYLARVWNLKCTDVMQSVVYGIYTEETEKHKSPTRLDSDDMYGTVFNRFVVQAMINEPLTIYGHGKHQRAFLSLNDSVQALTLAIENPAEKGVVQTWNQLSEWHSIDEIIDIVKTVKKEIRTVNIDSPRKEFTGGHYYNLKSDKLKALGYVPTRTMEQEMRYIFDNIRLTSGLVDKLKKVVAPRVMF